MATLTAISEIIDAMEGGNTLVYWEKEGAPHIRSVSLRWVSGLSRYKVYIRMKVFERMVSMGLLKQYRADTQRDAWGTRYYCRYYQLSEIIALTESMEDRRFVEIDPTKHYIVVMPSMCRLDMLKFVETWHRMVENEDKPPTVMVLYGEGAAIIPVEQIVVVKDATPVLKERR